MKSESRKKYLLKNTIIFSIGNFGSKLITFFLVPLYTNILTTSEYGTIDIMTVLTTIVVPIATLNISESIMRFSMDDNSNKNDILSIGMLFVLISAVLFLLLIPVFFIFGISINISFLLAVYMLSFATSTILLCYLRGIEKLLDYSLICIVQTLFIAILNIYFLVVMKLGIAGYILAYSIAYILTILLCLLRGKMIKNFFRENGRINRQLLKKMLKYSVLLIPNSLMWWIMNSLDHFMVTSIIGISANGVYAVSYKIPTILITLTTIFNQAWMFSAVKEKDSIDKNQYTNNVFHFLFVTVITISIILLLILKPLLWIYVGHDFIDAWKYVPPLLFGSTILTLGTFLSNEYTANKDSQGFLKSSVIGAVINLILNFALINRIGIIGAAISTCISYFSVFMYRVFDTKKYVKINVFSIKNIIEILLLFISSIVVYFDNYIFHTIIIILILIVLGILERKTLKDIFKNVIKKFKRGDKNG